MSFTGDRLHVHGASTIDASPGSSLELKITNSLLEDPTLKINTIDDVAPGSHLTFAFNTIVFTSQNNQLACPNDAGAAHRMVTFEDSILVALAPPTAQPSVVSGTSCSFSHSVLFPQPTGLANNLVADPQFVDTAGKDYHLKPTSPAIDAAMPSVGLTSDHDLDGTARPQGAAPDIGAYELKP